MVCRKLLEMQRNAMDRFDGSEDSVAFKRAQYDLIDIQYAIDAGIHAPGCNCEPDDDEDDTPIYVEHGGES